MSAREVATGAPVRVVLTRGLVLLFPGAPTEIELRAETVGDLLDALDSRWPGMRDRLCDTRPAIRRYISVFANGQRAELDTPLAPGAEVYILTAMSGG